jgi:hypothetical protein
MIEINYPESLTYYIIWTNDDVSYGALTSEQCLSSGRENLYTTLDKNELINELLTNFNIVYKEESGREKFII